MRRLATDLKVGMVALLVTLATALVVLFLWYQNHQISREFLNEARKVTGSLPVLAVTEGQVATWTNELRQNETVKGEMEQHFAEQINQVRTGETTPEQFSKHISECKRFCGLLMDKVFKANAEEIAKLPHDIVLFDLDRDNVKTHERQRLEQFVSKTKDRTFYLVGRASQIGAAGYNLELSARRVRQVTLALSKAGVPIEQIRSYWLGVEAPQLTHELANLYGFPPDRYRNDLFQLNQSVTLFAFAPGQQIPAGLDLMSDTSLTASVSRSRQVSKKSRTESSTATR
ncbi:MAG: OmpA family protein [Acidobacteriota bacterium]